MQTFGQWLQAQIDERGWKAPELARRSDLSNSTVYAYLRDERGSGTRPPGQANLQKLANGLGIPFAQVLSAAGLADPNQSPEQKSALYWSALGRDLSEEDRRTAEAMLLAFRRTRGYKS